LEKKKRSNKDGINKEDLSKVLKGFYKESLEPKFNQIDKRFDRVEARLDLHDAHFEKIEKKLEEHDEKFRDIFIHFDQISNVQALAPFVCIRLPII
jgi:hypothetical protein